METQNPKTKKGCIPLLLILGIISAIALYITMPNSNEVKNNRADGSVWQIKAHLKTNLKDPKSYQAIEWGEVRQIKKDPAQYVVRHKYRAKNSLGGQVITIGYFTLNAKGDVIKVEY